MQDRMRILLVEDFDRRLEYFREHTPPEFSLVEARSAGRALGILRRDRGRVYDGILLDHDLLEHLAAEGEERFSGSDVVLVIIAHVDTSVPVLVHSANSKRAIAMKDKLEAAGFDVTRIPFSEMTAVRYRGWLAFVREMHEEYGA